jgi:hypothetical protein
LRYLLENGEDGCEAYQAAKEEPPKEGWAFRRTGARMATGNRCKIGQREQHRLKEMRVS